ncbi:hypothetical protein AQUCO_09400018v1 [Aquilegia coerulea]|uniref:Myb/SANT-like domain-containing protein n=1 Tax=Aquilegia coerulea TaxID=218851 RepID=A0A2G5C533_AQUCA|nr:hypothetical protein AQUCO_09400018v1 [Aquilegia coerulea]
MANPHKVFTNTLGLRDRFIDICVEEFDARNYKGTCLIPESWKQLEKELNEEFGLQLNHKALKNHWDDLKRKYMAWRYLRGKTRNLYNSETGLFNMTEEDWQEYIFLLNILNYFKLLKHPKAKEIRSKPLTRVNDLMNIYEVVLSAGGFRWGPSNTAAPQNEDQTIPPNEQVEADEATQVDENIDNSFEDTHLNEEENGMPRNQNERPSVEKGSSSKKRRRSFIPDSNVVEKVATLISEQVSLMKSESEKKDKEKVEMEAYSVQECVNLFFCLNKSYGLTDDMMEKAMMKLCEKVDVGVPHTPTNQK